MPQPLILSPQKFDQFYVRKRILEGQRLLLTIESTMKCLNN